MISKTGLHALKALAVLSRLPEGEYIGAATLAKEIGAPENYLGKLLQTLTYEGLVESQKGKGGGFRMAKDSKKTSLYDVIEPIEQVSRWEGCFLGRSRCSSSSPCNLHDKWKMTRDTYLNFLKSTNLSEISDKD
ncbi:MAG: Rrf2 family transcriptional regulator [Bdellovibrio sp.]|nr:Rrf2 family transcriptional regulator [Bdellovibrio sp.]